MNKQGIRWLYKELPDLIATGILTQDTADKLRRHYGEIKAVAKNAVTLIILGSIGALLIGLGIILLIGHNWEDLSRFTRGVISFLPLIAGQALALWVMWKRPESAAFKEGSATFLSLMVGASIALVCQTYNIPGDAGIFTLSWMLLIAPIVYLMQATLPAVIYLIGITVWAGTYWNEPLKAVVFWPLAAVIIPHFVWSLRQELYVLRSIILSLIMIICASIGASFSLGKTWDGAWIIIFPSLYSIFYFLGWLDSDKITVNWQRPMRFIGAVGLFVCAFIFTFKDIWKLGVSYSYGINRNISDLSAIPDHIISLSIVAVSMLLFYDFVKRKNITVCLFGAVPLLAIIAYFLKGPTGLLPIVIFNAYLLFLSVSRIASGIRNNSLGIINSGMLMLAILIIARFFDSDISFVIKGLVFIAVGVGFLVTNVALARRLGGVK